PHADQPYMRAPTTTSPAVSPPQTQCSRRHLAIQGELMRTLTTPPSGTGRANVPPQTPVGAEPQPARARPFVIRETVNLPRAELCPPRHRAGGGRGRVRSLHMLQTVADESENLPM